MTETRTMWHRIRSAIDAVSVARLLIFAVAFVVWRGSPLFALGATFAMPIVLALLVWIGRALYFALTGRVPGAPPARLGVPLSQRRHNGSLQLTERHASGYAPTSRIRSYSSRRH